MPIAARLRYIWRRLYPERSELVGFYPLFARHPWLIPISPLYRVFVSLRHRPDQLRGELQRLSGRKSSGRKPSGQQAGERKSNGRKPSGRDGRHDGTGHQGDARGE